MITEHSLTASVQTPKLMAFQGQEPVRSKIETGNKIIEQVNSFNYLENFVSYEKEMDIDSKMNNYLKTTGIINNMFIPQKTLKKTRLKLYSTLVLTGLLYGSQNWAIKARDTRRITVAEMKYMRKTARIHVDRL
jgi:hypothetical protein